MRLLVLHLGLWVGLLLVAGAIAHKFWLRADGVADMVLAVGLLYVPFGFYGALREDNRKEEIFYGIILLLAIFSP